MNETWAAAGYDPEKLKEEYDRTEHGRVRISCIRSAIEAADAHEDTSYRIYFRLELCRESTFYGDGMDMMVIFQIGRAHV